MRWTGAVAGLVAGGVLALSACSAGGGSGDPAASADGPPRPTTTSSAAAGSTTTTTGTTGPSRAAYSVAFGDAFAGIDRANRCVAGRMVDAVGLDRLHAAGVTPEDFAGGEIFDALGIDEDGAAALAAEAEDALDVCGTVDLIADEYLQSDDPTWDLTEFTPCVAEPLGPLLAQVVVQAWRGDLEDDVDDATTDAVLVADAACPTLQVEATRRAAADAGVVLTDAELACTLDHYTQLAAQHRVITPADEDDLDATCFG